jgi:hypothetical protein
LYYFAEIELKKNLNIDYEIRKNTRQAWFA